jgi:hypothetical protein
MAQGDGPNLGEHPITSLTLTWWRGEEFDGFTIVIPGGHQMSCTRWISKLTITM